MTPAYYGTIGIRGALVMDETSGADEIRHDPIPLYNVSSMYCFLNRSFPFDDIRYRIHEENQQGEAMFKKNSVPNRFYRRGKD